MAKDVIKLIFIDVKNQLIKIIDKEVREYDLKNIQEVANEISGSEVLYITSLEKVNGTDVIEMISSHVGSSYIEPVRTGLQYLHACKPSRIIVPHKNPEYEPLILDGPSDFKPFSENMHDNFPFLSRYIEINCIEIVEENSIYRTKKEYEEKNSKLKLKKQKAKDDDLNSILVQDKAQRTIDRIENEGYTDDLGSVELDITDDVNAASEGHVEESDFLKTIKEAGIDIDSDIIGKE